MLYLNAYQSEKYGEVHTWFDVGEIFPAAIKSRARRLLTSMSIDKNNIKKNTLIAISCFCIPRQFLNWLEVDVVDALLSLIELWHIFLFCYSVCNRTTAA